MPPTMPPSENRFLENVRLGAHVMRSMRRGTTRICMLCSARYCRGSHARVCVARGAPAGRAYALWSSGWGFAGQLAPRAPLCA